MTSPRNPAHPVLEGCRHPPSPHHELEGVQFRDQKEIESQEDLAIVVRDLADLFYETFVDGLDSSEREEPSDGLTMPDD